MDLERKPEYKMNIYGKEFRVLEEIDKKKIIKMYSGK